MLVIKFTLRNSSFLAIFLHVVVKCCSRFACHTFYPEGITCGNHPSHRLMGAVSPHNFNLILNILLDLPEPIEFFNKYYFGIYSFWVNMGSRYSQTLLIWASFNWIFSIRTENFWSEHPEENPSISVLGKENRFSKSSKIDILKQFLP